jgi:MFS family permease
VPAFRLSCLAYLGVALPASSLGLLWPSMRLSFHQPVGALGLALALGAIASVLSSTALASAPAGRLLARLGPGPLVAAGTLLVALALATEAAAPGLALFTAGTVIFGLGMGALDAVINAHGARHFGPRQVTWMHASYGLGALLGPLLTTALLSGALGWRWVYGAMAVQQAGLALLLAMTRRSWDSGPVLPINSRNGPRSAPADQARNPAPSIAVTLAALTFAAVESGIESAAGLWGYLFLTAGRGLSHPEAGLAVAGYWATMLAGRAVLGPVAERLGARRVLAAAVAGVPVGAAVMAAPGPPLLAVAGLMLLGLTAAPVFPLLTLTTAARAGDRAATRAVTLQVAASAAGSAAVPAGVGLALGGGGAARLAPVLLALGLAMCALGWPLGNRARARRVP